MLENNWKLWYSHKISNIFHVGLSTSPVLYDCRLKGPWLDIQIFSPAYTSTEIPKGPGSDVQEGPEPDAQILNQFSTFKYGSGLTENMGFKRILWNWFTNVLVQSLLVIVVHIYIYTERFHYVYFCIWTSAYVTLPLHYPLDLGACLRPSSVFFIMTIIFYLRLPNHP